MHHQDPLIPQTKLHHLALVSNEQTVISIYLTLDEEFIEELYDDMSPVFTNKSSSITSTVSTLIFHNYNLKYT